MKLEVDPIDIVTVEGNKVNLCDSGSKVYPGCDAEEFLFGDGDNNICCCNMYVPGEKNG